MFDRRVNLCTLLDRGGTIVTLPYDLCTSFARFLAINNLSNTRLRRYQAGRVYRSVPDGGQPREVQLAPLLAYGLLLLLLCVFLPQ